MFISGHDPELVHNVNKHNFKCQYWQMVKNTASMQKRPWTNLHSFAIKKNYLNWVLIYKGKNQLKLLNFMLS